MESFSLFGMSQVNSLLATGISLITSVLIGAVVIKHHWEKVSFFMTRVKIGFPFFGRMTRLSKDINSISEKKWFFSEEDMSSSFLPYYEKAEDLDETYYAHCHGYLRKALDLGVKPLSMIGWGLIIAMVIVEAMGFSYVLAGYTLPGASEGMQQKGALGIAFLISTVLVFLTHWTGSEMKINSAIKKARVWFNKSGDQNTLKPNSKVSLASDSIDEEDPDYRQLISRIKEVSAEVTPSWKITSITIVFVLAVAVGSTYVRGKVLEGELIAESTGQIETTVPNYSSLYSESNLPSGLTSAARAADNKAQTDVEDTQRKGGWATFIVLAVIFVFLQLLGTLMGYKTAFIGRESKAAYKVAGRFKNARDFANYYKRERNFIANTAQKYLSKLQKLMAQRSEKVNVDGASRDLISQNNGRTFLAYVERMHEENLDSEHKRKEKSSRHDGRMSAINSAPSDTPASKPAPVEQTLEERKAEMRAKLIKEQEDKAKAEAEAAIEKASSISDDDLEAQMRAEMEAEASAAISDEELEAQMRAEMEGSKA